MKVTNRHAAAMIGGLSLLSSFALAAWLQLNSGTTAELYSVHFPEGTQVGSAVGAGMDSLGGLVGVILKTTDRGDTWQTMNVGHVNALSSVYFKNNDSGYAVGTAGTAIRTTDGGATWTAMTVPTTDLLTKVQFPENGQIGYIGVNPRAGGGEVLRTTNGGDSWASISVGGAMNTSYSCAMATDNIGVVIGYQGMLYGTTDGCSTFTAQGPQTIADIVAAAFSPDPNVGYLIGNDSTRGVIRHTDDGGATLWDTVRHYPIRAFYGVDMPTSEVAWVCGTDGMILRSVTPHDFYRSTTQATANMHGLCFPNGADTGYAVGAGGVILRTYDGGLPWSP